MPVMDALALLAGAAVAAISSSVAAVMAQTSLTEQRGAIAGWINAGQLGGKGVGGGVALWIAKASPRSFTASLAWPWSPRRA